MLQDTEAAHGMLFRSLVITGGLISMHTDFAQLTPHPDTSAYAHPSIPLLMTLVNLARRLVIAGAVGFVFAPATGVDHGVSGLREVGRGATGGKTSVKATLLGSLPLRELPSEERAKLGRTAIIGTVHCVLASAMLSALPSLDFIAAGHDAWYLVSGGGVHWARLVQYDPCAVAYTLILGLRLLHVLTIQVCMSVFVFHFLVGFFLPGDHSHKGFWAEYCACRLFCQLMLLAAINSWFSWPHLFDAMPVLVQYVSLSLATCHFVVFAAFCVRNLFLVLRNVDYSEGELAAAFDQWRWKEDVFQAGLDLQLQFVEGVQEQLQEVNRQGGSVKYLTNLFKQLKVLVKIYRGVPREKEEETVRGRGAAKKGAGRARSKTPAGSRKKGQ